jgi:hypothetical protein
MKILQASQPAKVRRDGAGEFGTAEVEDGEEREITNMGGDLSLEGNTR